jgi:hypothetical protein
MYGFIEPPIQAPEVVLICYSGFMVFIPVIVVCVSMSLSGGGMSENLAGEIFDITCINGFGIGSHRSEHGSKRS